MDITYYVAASLDGYIATPDGKVDWLASFEGGSEDYGYSQFLASIDALFLGSLTYEFILSLPSWPYLNKPSWVFSQRSLPVIAPNVHLTNAKPSEIVAELDNQGLDRAWLIGGAKLASGFRAERLITRYIISVIPIILGQGIPLLMPIPGSDPLHLIRSLSFPSGLVQLEYLVG